MQQIFFISFTSVVLRMRWQQGSLSMKHDHMFMARNLLHLLSPLFLSQYHTHEELSVDEAMIPFKVRLGIKHYMKDKPTKWGIKVFALADAKTGYNESMYIWQEPVLPNAAI